MMKIIGQRREYLNETDQNGIPRLINERLHIAQNLDGGINGVTYAQTKASSLDVRDVEPVIEDLHVPHKAEVADSVARWIILRMSVGLYGCVSQNY